MTPSEFKAKWKPCIGVASVCSPYPVQDEFEKDFTAMLVKQVANACSTVLDIREGTWK